MNSLAGRVTLVTGGGSGIGRAVVDRFLAEGASVVAMEKRPANADALRALNDPHLVVVEGDVTSYDDNARAVNAATDTFGRLDAFIGNVGIWDFSRALVDLTPEELESGFHDMFSVNVLGYLLGARAAAEALRNSRGTIVLTLSNASFYPQGGGVLYTASKHAGLGVVRQLAYEFAPEVRVNGVAPGGANTHLTGPRSLGLDHRTIEDIPLQAYQRKYSALEYAIEPADYAGAYVLLASASDALTVTGTVIDLSSAGTPQRPR